MLPKTWRRHAPPGSVDADHATAPDELCRPQLLHRIGQASPPEGAERRGGEDHRRRRRFLGWRDPVTMPRPVLWLFTAVSALIPAAWALLAHALRDDSAALLAAGALAAVTVAAGVVLLGRA